MTFSSRYIKIWVLVIIIEAEHKDTSYTNKVK